MDSTRTPDEEAVQRWWDAADAGDVSPDEEAILRERYGVSSPAQIRRAADSAALRDRFLLEHGISHEVAAGIIVTYEQDDPMILEDLSRDFDPEVEAQGRLACSRGGGIAIVRHGYGLPERDGDTADWRAAYPSWKLLPVTTPPQLRAWPCTAKKHGPKTTGCSCVYTDTTPRASYHPHDDRDVIRNTPLLNKATHDQLRKLEKDIRESEGEVRQALINAKLELEAEIKADRPLAQVHDEKAPKPKHHLRYAAALAAKGTVKQRVGHIMKWHGGNELLDELGIKRSDLTEHELHRLCEVLNDKSQHYHYPGPAKYLNPPGEWGKVIDIHPIALERLLAGVDRVYFVIEGSIKALAVLTEILRTGENAAVVSVPSVTLWDDSNLETRESHLADFVQEHLVGREVVVIYDADGHDNALVFAQAMMLQDRLQALGVEHVVAAAPPLAAENEIETYIHPVFGKVDRKGVDDDLALFNGTLDGLIVRERTTDLAAALNAVQGKVSNRTMERHVRILTTLPRYAVYAPGDEPGRPSRLVKSVQAFEKVTGISRRALANRRMYDEDGNVTGEKPGYLAIQHEHIRSFDLDEGDSFDAKAKFEDAGGVEHNWDWENRPHLTIRPEFRAREVSYRLSEWPRHRTPAETPTAFARAYAEALRIADTTSTTTPKR
jgi:hypothetical protein